MKVSSLASGSSGNCFYVENGNDALLVDAGISCKQIWERISEVGGDVNKVRGVFVTHEHSDHVRGVDVFARHFNVPVFAPKKVAENCFLCSNQDLIQPFMKDENFKIGSLNIQSFPKSHDALDPVSYNIENGAKLSIITDIGFISDNVKDFITDSDFLIIESNHDKNMLMEGPYPWFLKNRINSDRGHLSNLDSAVGVLQYAQPHLKNLMLAHLSQTNNTPNLAYNFFKNVLKDNKTLKPNLIVADRFSTSDLLKV
ncbi:MAG: MBL fold metallo-hydrolase [Nanoarchaeota archaeon]|nr:MBL fold metallo-hydrolase [Nanoarchaeota archaeon]